MIPLPTNTRVYLALGHTDMRALLVREGRLTPHDYRQIHDLILMEMEDIEIRYVTPEVVTQTIQCLENSPLPPWMHYISAALSSYSLICSYLQIDDKLRPQNGRG